MGNGVRLMNGPTQPEFDAMNQLFLDLVQATNGANASIDYLTDDLSEVDPLIARREQLREQITNLMAAGYRPSMTIGFRPEIPNLDT